MNKLHHLLDTRDKRDIICATIYSLAIFIIGLTHIYLALQIYFVNTYDQLFGLLETVVVQSTFLGKLTIQMMSQLNASLLKIIQIILSSMSIIDWIIVIFTLLFIFMKPVTKHEKKIKLNAQINTCLFMLGYIVLILVLMLAFMMGSLMKVVTLLHILAITIGLIGIIFILLNGYNFFWNIFVLLPEFMSVIVEEVVEYEEVSQETN